MPKHGSNIALRPRKPEGSLGRTAQGGHLDSHTAPEHILRSWSPLVPFRGQLGVKQIKRANGEEVEKSKARASS